MLLKNKVFINNLFKTTFLFFVRIFKQLIHNYFVNLLYTLI